MDYGITGSGFQKSMQAFTILDNPQAEGFRQRLEYCSSTTDSVFPVQNNKTLWKINHDNMIHEFLTKLCYTVWTKGL